MLAATVDIYLDGEATAFANNIHRCTECVTVRDSFLRIHISQQTIWFFQLASYQPTTLPYQHRHHANSHRSSDELTSKLKEP
jgi:hypothetical protein